ncbi:hypothetical protein [Mycobacteroides abscessus]|uniref:hypothetical protein n=1 Tax=Mycobacteroides abscessus TaxID=36809 RepID=UPI00092914AC|nr:hypothetical protein [Mycobacteroides abscessus]MBN7371106.1 hypothetical protein [Mycobacteroides abscessus subsp. abscessus]MBN7522615.1 hypothetical protein [Mycobacteroides abscessus subsp. abscessus]MDB2185158.1 hypothetical protein [Mycobacteroides abscessus subsp. abscessus]MDO3123489.1 hypothetical protein [Mycobacteroides abscessus subsp. abscessus]MDO3173300.1 hypothetical protein [Mycobacteroides abscessus subsp. abscessus]
MIKTTELTTVDARWNARALPVFEARAVIGAWSTDEELDEQADTLSAVYGSDSGDLHDLLHAVRSYFRDAALSVEGL